MVFSTIIPNCSNINSGIQKSAQKSVCCDLFLVHWRVEKRKQPGNATLKSKDLNLSRARKLMCIL